MWETCAPNSNMKIQIASLCLHEKRGENVLHANQILRSNSSKENKTLGKKSYGIYGRCICESFLWSFFIVLLIDKFLLCRKKIIICRTEFHCKQCVPTFSFNVMIKFFLGVNFFSKWILQEILQMTMKCDFLQSVENTEKTQKSFFTHGSLWSWIETVSKLVVI